MPIKEISNILDGESIYDRALELRKEGWKIKAEWEKNNDGRELKAVRCNFKHVNIRGKNEYQRRVWGWQNGYLVVGWVFEVYVRNANGGYVREHVLLDLEDAIAKAKEHAKAPEPEIPTWNKGDLPDAFPFDGESVIRYGNGTRFRRTVNNRIKVFNTAFVVLVYDVSAVGIVSIGRDCSVSLDAAIAPGNEAWFLLECYGTEGAFSIVTDGEKFYPIKKISQGRDKDPKMKLSLDLKVNKQVDLSMLTATDIQRIQITVREFANWYADEFE